MNSAVEPLLKAINDLSARVNTLEAEKWELIGKTNALDMRIIYLEWEVGRLRDELNSLTTNTTSIPYWGYTWSSYTSEPLHPYWEPVPTTVGITDIRRAENWNLLVTYSDGRVETINPVL
jgi:hypothetical protein